MTDALGPTSPHEMRELVLALARRGELASAADLAELMMRRTASYEIPPPGDLGRLAALADRDCEHEYWRGTYRVLISLSFTAIARPRRRARRVA